MSETFSPQAAAEQARETFRKTTEQFEKLSLETTVPEAYALSPRDGGPDARGL